MKKVPTIHKIIKGCEVGDMISDGLRTWKVTESKTDGGDCVVAQPHNWNRKTMGPSFEIWDDAQAKISIIPNLQVINAV